MQQEEEEEEEEGKTKTTDQPTLPKQNGRLSSQQPKHGVFQIKRNKEGTVWGLSGG